MNPDAHWAKRRRLSKRSPLLESQKSLPKMSFQREIVEFKAFLHELFDK
jgi:DTW domain-containing protein YfiP